MPLLVFITAFAPGETGAIHAYLLDPQHAIWKPVSKTTDVEHPFFLAISPDKKYLYSIHAPGEFGGQKDEQVAAYRITSDQGELQLINRQSSRGAASCYLDKRDRGGLDQSRRGAAICVQRRWGSIPDVRARDGKNPQSTTPRLAQS